MLQDAFDPINPQIEIVGVYDWDGTPFVRAQFVLLPGDGQKELPKGPEGDPGPPGEPGPPLRFVKYVEDISEVNQAALGPADAHKVWANTVTNDIYHWDGATLQTWANSLAVPGEPGPSSTLAIGTVSTSAPGGLAEVAASGLPPNQTLDLTLPQGPQGPDGEAGPSGPILLADDFDDTAPLTDGDVLTYNSTTGKVQGRRPRGLAGPLTLTVADFDQTSKYTGSAQVATLDIPVVNFDYRVYVTGELMVEAGTNSGEYYGHITVQSTGVTVGRGWRSLGSGLRAAPIRPHYEQKISVGSTHGVIDGSVPQTLLVSVVRHSGTTSYSISSNNATNLHVLIIPE